MAITVKDQIFSLETANTLYQMKADSFGVVKHLWYGEKTGVSMEYLLDYPDVGFSGNIYEAENDRTYSLNTMPLEYAGSGRFPGTSSDGAACRWQSGTGFTVSEIFYQERKIQYSGTAGSLCRGERGGNTGDSYERYGI